MSQKENTPNVGQMIAVAIGLPIVIVWGVLCSPFLLFWALVAFFSSDQQNSANVSSGGTASTENQRGFEGKYVLIAAGLFSVLLISYALMSRGTSATTPSGSHGNPTSVHSTQTPSHVWVNGYYRTDGSYVPGHYRTAPDGVSSNNWSNSPNTNPYTHKPGTRHSK